MRILPIIIIVCGISYLLYFLQLFVLIDHRFFIAIFGGLAVLLAVGYAGYSLPRWADLRVLISRLRAFATGSPRPPR